MRAVVQRVSQASVTGGGKTAEIARGLCVLVGFEKEDTERERDALIAYLLKLRLFDAPEAMRPWSLNVCDIKAQVLLVSQFTINAQIKSGKPSFHRAMPPGPANEMWDKFVAAANDAYPDHIKSCVFGSMMNVHIVNDGPFTICLSAVDGKCTTW